LYLPTTPSEWLDATTGAKIRRTKATFPTFVKDFVGTKWFNANLKGRTGAPSEWGKFLSKVFGTNETANRFILRAANAMRTAETARAQKISLRRPAVSFRPNLDEIGTHGKVVVFSIG
jgi:hypothetical protein